MASAKHHFIRNLAAALLAGEWRIGPMNDRAARACGKRHRWIRPLVRRVLARFPDLPASRPLYDYLNSDREFFELWGRSFWATPGYTRFKIAEVCWAPDHMADTRMPVGDRVSRSATTGEWLTSRDSTRPAGPG